LVYCKGQTERIAKLGEKNKGGRVKPPKLGSRNPDLQKSEERKKRKAILVAPGPSKKKGIHQQIKNHWGGPTLVVKGNAE